VRGSLRVDRANIVSWLPFLRGDADGQQDQDDNREQQIAISGHISTSSG
jgi:hypothetical protein